MDGQNVLQLSREVLDDPCLVDEVIIKSICEVHQKNENMISDAESYEGEGQEVETSNVELLISLLLAHIPHQVANDQDIQDSL